MSEGASISDITEDYEHRIQAWKKKHDEQLAANLRLVNRNIYLAEEVERLREAIQRHREKTKSYVFTPPSPADRELWTVLDGTDDD